MARALREEHRCIGFLSQGQGGEAQVRLPEPMTALRLTLPLIGSGATAATSRLGRSKLKHVAVAQGGKPRGSLAPGNVRLKNADRRPATDGRGGQTPISRFPSPLSCDWPFVHYRSRTQARTRASRSHTLVTVAHFRRSFFA